MALFLDTGDIGQIGKYVRMGVIRGVTTNPTILLKSCGCMSEREMEKRIREIAALIEPYPLSVEVTTNDTAKMLAEAVQYASWAKNINVKITIHGPEGELENLEVVNELEKKRGVRVNVTAMMSAQQCLVAALAGATYVSIFAGRVNNMGYDSVSEIAKTRRLLDLQKLPAKLIAGSTREVLNVEQWLSAGADIVTVLPELLKGMIVHPYTKETVRMFLADAAAGLKGSPGAK